MRSSGILLPITSLPSPYGIGTLGKAAYEFADFLEKAAQKYWQILPITPTSYGDSPYQSFSTFAGNPYLIDLDFLSKDGLLEEAEFADINWGDDKGYIDYARIFELRFSVLKIAFKRFASQPLPNEYKEFKKANRFWLDDYALYMAIKGAHNNRPWTEWERPLRFREKAAIAQQKRNLKDEIEFWQFLQFEFFKQWGMLKEYLNEKKIKIIGDIPIYVALDSSDVWANPQLFALDEELLPTVVAGCPPDYFSATGQLWGNPVYDWERHKADGYKWWISRISAAVSIYDTVRIDHFRGFEAFYAIPAEDDTAVNGKWCKGPGIELFNKIKKKVENASIIAEDLGIITDEVRALLSETGYPGMKVMQFAFTAGYESAYLPHNHIQNCVCYTGTHDNDTLAGWVESMSEADLEYTMAYCHAKTKDELPKALLATAWESCADLVVAQMQDFLGLGSEARMNIPSTLGGNWAWRLDAASLSDELAEEISQMTKLYWRS